MHTTSTATSATAAGQIGYRPDHEQGSEAIDSRVEEVGRLLKHWTHARIVRIHGPMAGTLQRLVFDPNSTQLSAGYSDGSTDMYCSQGKRIDLAPEHDREDQQNAWFLTRETSRRFRVGSILRTCLADPKCISLHQSPDRTAIRDPDARVGITSFTMLRRREYFAIALESGRIMVFSTRKAQSEDVVSPLREFMAQGPCTLCYCPVSQRIASCSPSAVEIWDWNPRSRNRFKTSPTHRYSTDGAATWSPRSSRMVELADLDECRRLIPHISALADDTLFLSHCSQSGFLRGATKQGGKFSFLPLADDWDRAVNMQEIPEDRGAVLLSDRRRVIYWSLDQSQPKWEARLSSDIASDSPLLVCIQREYDSSSIWVGGAATNSTVLWKLAPGEGDPRTCELTVPVGSAYAAAIAPDAAQPHKTVPTSNSRSSVLEYLSQEEIFPILKQLVAKQKQKNYRSALIGGHPNFSLFTTAFEVHLQSQLHCRVAIHDGTVQRKRGHAHDVALAIPNAAAAAAKGAAVKTMPTVATYAVAEAAKVIIEVPPEIAIEKIADAIYKHEHRDLLPALYEHGFDKRHIQAIADTLLKFHYDYLQSSVCSDPAEFGRKAARSIYEALRDGELSKCNGKELLDRIKTEHCRSIQD